MFGTVLFSVALLAFGIQHVVFARSAAGAMYPWVPGPPAWNYVFGIFLVAAAGGIALGKRARWAAGALGTGLCLYALVLYVPRLAAQVRAPGPLTRVVGLGSPLAAASEILAMAGAAWALAGRRKWGRALFAGALVVFGLQHVLFSRFLGTLIPAWIPGHAFWEAVVGAAFLAAAAALATGRAARLAAFLLGTMFLLIVLVLHAPRVAAAIGNVDEWTSALVAVAMSGGAFVFAGAATVD
jgi:uncharacterized membrane protein